MITTQDYCLPSFLKSRCLTAAAVACLAMSSADAVAQDVVRYTGTELSDPHRHDGGLSPVVGVHNIQIMRANREHPAPENGMGWTYNHQPMMAYWHGRFYVHYLCDPKDEQVPPSHTLMQTSRDGYTWTTPVMLFPEYDVPEGFTKPGIEDAAHNMKAVMHQRMGFYVSTDDRLYAIGSYGVCLSKKDHNNDGNGIGRVIREVKDDGTLGKIYFIYYNHDFNEKNTDFPNYRRGDKYLRRAVAEIYANPRIRMQWVEEADREDPLIPLNKPYKAYNDYTLPDGRLVALWKHALTSISEDGGNTWSEPVGRAPGFVNSNAKIWGQRLSDGTYATVYNPSEFRWPLAISLSADGLNYTTLNLVNGEVPPMRYGGNYKSFGPQYVRGIQEGNGTPPDGDMWLTYSMNKEDMWVARVPVPVRINATAHADDDFSRYTSLAELTDWNIYSPLQAPAGIEGKWLTLADSDRHDYCRVERKIPPTRELAVEFTLKAGQNSHGWLQVEFLDKDGVPCSRLELTDTGEMRCKGGARYARVMTYEPDREYRVRAELSVSTRTATIYIDGKKAATRMFFAPVESIERVMMRTGTMRLYPTVDTPADWDGILRDAGESDKKAVFAIADFKTAQLEKTADGNTGLQPAVLRYDDFRHYVDFFNEMEDENIVQAIPNAGAWDWMKHNVPLFECSQKTVEEMFWYRWWTLRKHIEETPAGWAMTEFLVKRNYADKWKLISSGVGHHIRESRWLHDRQYLDQIINTWYHGNEGKPMAKFLKYSSWVPSSIWERYLVDGNRQWVVSQLPDMEWDYNYWVTTHRLPSGLIWQEDVRDAMEETISGGRKKQYARPSINSYVYGSAKAISYVAQLAGDEKKAEAYRLKADTLQRLTETLLWNERHLFFETHRGDSSANVREAIGFMPWYMKMPIDNTKYGVAWQQIADEQGFDAPYGLTTAERRHPEFRTHGVGQCEWDGAVWPFATSQTLTGYINYINSLNENDTTLNAHRMTFFRHVEKYVQSQHMRGKPYIGEYLDETTGYWLKGDQERSRYYNHSTFNDIIITGICGIQPQPCNALVVNPLLPAGAWTYFCLDNVLYHGRRITVIYDIDGKRYHQGKGLSVFVDGVLRAHADTLRKLTVTL